MPLNADGHGAILNQMVIAKRYVSRRLRQRFPNIHFMPGSDTNIVSCVLAPEGAPLSEVNRITGVLIEGFEDSPNFAISRTSLSRSNYGALVESVVREWGGELDDDHLLVMRMVIMSPYLGEAATTDRLLAEFLDEMTGFYRSALA
jgi:hypothetical protein